MQKPSSGSSYRTCRSGVWVLGLEDGAALGRNLLENSHPRLLVSLILAAAVRPPVELRVAHLHAPATPVDEVHRLVVEPREREIERVTLAAEVGGIPLELARQHDHPGGPTRPPRAR